MPAGRVKPLNIFQHATYIRDHCVCAGFHIHLPYLLAAFFLLLGLVVDLTHRALDPRLKHSGVVSGKAEA